MSAQEQDHARNTATNEPKVIPNAKCNEGQTNNGSIVGPSLPRLDHQSSRMESEAELRKPVPGTQCIQSKAQNMLVIEAEQNEDDESAQTRLRVVSGGVKHIQESQAERCERNHLLRPEGSDADSVQQYEDYRADMDIVRVEQVASR